MFPCLPTHGNIVAETKFASREANIFPTKFRNIPKCDFCCGNIVSLFAHMFPAGKHFFQIRTCAKTNNTKKMAKSPEVTAVVAYEQSNKNI
jgi:hypothetical protein